MDWKAFDLAVWNLADGASDTLNVPLYFARYSDPLTGDLRVELQLNIEDKSDTEMEDYFHGLKGIVKCSIVPCDGSFPHAAAYVLSRLLRGKGEPLTKDTVHWLLNMVGYSYPQEIRLHCEAAASMAENMEKLT